MPLDKDAFSGRNYGKPGGFKQVDGCLGECQNTTKGLIGLVIAIGIIAVVLTWILGSY